MDIEILEEYEDLIIPAMQPDTEKGGGDNNRPGGMDDNVSESSESVDMDIFDESSDEETNAVTERVVENVMQKRHQVPDDSEDSLEKLVREIVYEREDQSASNSLTSCLRKNSNCDKSNSNQTVQKHVAFAPLPAVQMTQSNVTARQPIETFDSVNAASASTTTRKPTIIKPEKIQFKDPDFDPLSLDQSDILNALSDVSDESFVSTTEVDVSQNEPSESSYGSVNSTTKSSTISTFISTADLPEKPQVISHAILVPADAALMDSLKNNTFEMDSKKIELPVSNNTLSSSQQANIKQNDELESPSHETTNAAEQQVQLETTSTNKEIAESSNITIEPIKQIEVEYQAKVIEKSENTQSFKDDPQKSLTETDEVKTSSKSTKAETDEELKATNPKEESAKNPKVPNIQSKNIKNEEQNQSKEEIKPNDKTVSNKSISSDEKPENDKMVQEKEANDKTEPSKNILSAEKLEKDNMAQEKNGNDKTEANINSPIENKKTEKVADKSSTISKSKQADNNKATNLTSEMVKTDTKEENISNKDKIVDSTTQKDTKYEKEIVQSPLPSKKALDRSKEETIQPPTNKQTNTTKTKTNSRSSSSNPQHSNVRSTNIKAESVKPKNDDSKKSSIPEKSGKINKIEAQQEKIENKATNKQVTDISETNSNPTNVHKNIESNSVKSMSKEPKINNSSFKSTEKTSLGTAPSSSNKQQQGSSEKANLTKRSNSVSGGKEQKVDLCKSTQQTRVVTPKNSNVLDSKKSLEKTATPSGINKPEQSPKKNDAVNTSNSQKIQKSAPSSSSSGSKQTPENTTKHKQTSNVTSVKKLAKSSSSSSLRNEDAYKKGDPSNALISNKLERSASSTNFKLSHEQASKKTNAVEPFNSKGLEKTVLSGSLKSEASKDTPKRKLVEEAENKTKLESAASSINVKSHTDKVSPKRNSTGEVANTKKPDNINSKSSYKNEDKKNTQAVANTKNVQESTSSSSLKKESSKDTPKRKQTSNTTNSKIEKTPSSSSLKSEGSTDTDGVSNTKNVQKSKSSSSLKSDESKEVSTKLEKKTSSSSLKNVEGSVSTKSKQSADTPVSNKLERSTSSGNLKQTQENTPKRKESTVSSNTKSLERSSSSASLKHEIRKETPKMKETSKNSKSLADKKESIEQLSSKQDLKTKEVEESNVNRSKSLQSNNDNKTTVTELSNITKTEKADNSNKQSTTKKQIVNQSNNKGIIKSESATSISGKSKESALRKSMIDTGNDTIKTKRENKEQKTVSAPITNDKTKTDNAKIDTKTVGEKASLASKGSKTTEELPSSVPDKSKETTQRIAIKRTQADKSNESNKPMQTPQATITTPKPKQNISKTEINEIAKKNVQGSSTNMTTNLSSSSRTPKEKVQQENVSVADSVVNDGMQQQTETSVEQAVNMTQTPAKDKKEFKTKGARKMVDFSSATDETQLVSSSSTPNVNEEKGTLNSKNTSAEEKLGESLNTVHATKVTNKQDLSTEINTTPKVNMPKKLPTDSSQHDLNNSIDEKRQLRKRGVEESPESGKMPTRSTAPKKVVTPSAVQLKRNTFSPADDVNTTIKKMKIENTRKSRRLCDEANSEEQLVSSTSSLEGLADGKVTTPKTKVKTIHEGNKTIAKMTTNEQKTTTSLPVEATQSAEQLPSTSKAASLEQLNKTETKSVASKQKLKTSKLETKSLSQKEKTSDSNEPKKLNETEAISKEATSTKENVDATETKSASLKESAIVNKGKKQETCLNFSTEAKSTTADNFKSADSINSKSKTVTLEDRKIEETISPLTTECIIANVDTSNTSVSISSKPTSETTPHTETCESLEKMSVQGQKMSDSNSVEPSVMTFSEWLARKNSRNETNVTNDSEKQENTIESPQAKTMEIPKNINQSKIKRTTRKKEIENLKESLGKGIYEALSETASEDETIEAQIKLRSSPRKLDGHANESKVDNDLPPQKQISKATVANSTKTSTKRSEKDFQTQQHKSKIEAHTQLETVMGQKNTMEDVRTEKTAPDHLKNPTETPCNEKQKISQQQSKLSIKPTIDEQTSLKKSTENKTEEMVADVVHHVTAVESIESTPTMTSTDLAAVEPTKPKRPRSELELLRESMPKEMLESGIDELIRAHADSPRCLTKRSIATALSASATGGRLNSRSTRRNPNTTLDASQPMRHTKNLRASEGKTKSLLHTSSAPGPLTLANSVVVTASTRNMIESPVKIIKVNNKDVAKSSKSLTTTKAMTSKIKCRKLRVRLNRSIVRRYLNEQRDANVAKSISLPSVQLQRTDTRKRKATQPIVSDAKRFASTISPATITNTIDNRTLARPQVAPQRHLRAILPKPIPVTLPTMPEIQTIETQKRATVSPTPMQVNDDLLLTPISVAPVLPTTPLVTSDGGRRGRKKRANNTSVTSSLGTNVASTAVSKQPILNRSAVTTPILTSSTLQTRTTTSQTATLAEAGFAPKRELDEDEYNNRPTSSAAAAAMSVLTSINYTPPADHQNSHSSSIPLVISGATSHSLPPSIIDNAGTRIYSYLHPTRYNSNHGNVMLDYCCPNLDGPMTAIDPTRRHDKIDAVVRELPAFISMETRLVTRAELEANNNTIPAAIRNKVQRMAGSKSTTPNEFAVIPTSATITRTSLNATVPASVASNVVPINLSALQRQLPSTTTLTAKSGPTQRTNMSSGVGAGNTSTTTMTTSTTPTAIIKPTTVEEMRAKNRVSLKNFDLLIKKHYNRISMLTFAERQRLQESMINSTQLMSRDIDMASRVFQEYVTHMAVVTARPASPPTPVAIAAASSTPTNVIAPTTSTPAAISPTTRSQAKRATKSVSSAPKMVRQTVPIYNSNRSIIGYQVQMVPKTLAENNLGQGAKTASLSSLASTTTNATNNSFSSPTASNSTMTPIGRRSGVFVIDQVAGKANKATPKTSILSNILSNTPTTTQRAVLHSSTPNTTTAAGSVVTRSGRGVNLRQQLSRTTTNTRMQATPSLSTSLPLASTTSTLSTSLPCLPTLTRNPHLPPICEPSNTATVISHASYGQPNLQGPSNNKTQLIVVNHDSLGNPLPATDESILPDECSNTQASLIKTETVDY